MIRDVNFGVGRDENSENGDNVFHFFENGSENGSVIVLDDLGLNQFLFNELDSEDGYIEEEEDSGYDSENFEDDDGDEIMAVDRDDMVNDAEEEDNSGRGYFPIEEVIPSRFLVHELPDGDEDTPLYEEEEEEEEDALEVREIETVLISSDSEDEEINVIDLSDSESVEEREEEDMDIDVCGVEGEVHLDDEEEDANMNGGDEINNEEPYDPERFRNHENSLHQLLAKQKAFYQRARRLVRRCQNADVGQLRQEIAILRDQRKRFRREHPNYRRQRNLTEDIPRRHIDMCYGCGRRFWLQRIRLWRRCEFCGFWLCPECGDQPDHCMRNN